MYNSLISTLNKFLFAVYPMFKENCIFRIHVILNHANKPQKTRDVHYICIGTIVILRNTLSKLQPIHNENEKSINICVYFDDFLKMKLNTYWVS
jgi:hypothetical protein